ncbi:MAG: hypothetical protein PHS54_00480 [Clostridia bacterium]|nr:hypothetical protein [Clostridia bacterium]
MNDMYSEEYDMAQDHVQTITERELDMIILKMGSLLSIIQNKKTNQAKMLLFLVKNEKFRNCFLRIAELNSFQHLVRCLMEKYPTLCESKVVSGALKRDNKLRKKSL